MTEVPVSIGKLDDLSMKIGQLIEGQRSLDKYTHDHAHDVGNLSGKIDGLEHRIGKQFGELEGRINRRVEELAAQLRAELNAQIALLTNQLATANVKIALLEGQEHRRAGALSAIQAVARTPMAWLVAGLAALWALITGRVHL